MEVLAMEKLTSAGNAAHLGVPEGGPTCWP